MLYTFYFLCHWLCHAYVIVCHSYVIHMWLVFTRISSVCHSYVTCMSLMCNRVSSVCHSYVLLCHSYALVCYTYFFFFFFSIWVFFHEHSRFTGQQGKGEGIYLTPLYHFHPLHRRLDISRAIAAESSPLHIAGSPTRTGNLWFPSTSC